MSFETFGLEVGVEQEVEAADLLSGQLLEQ